jgi:hypothetical protein
LVKAKGGWTLVLRKPILNKKIDVGGSNRKGLIVSELESFIGEDRNGNAAMSSQEETIDKLRCTRWF